MKKSLTIRYFAVFRENAGTGEEVVSMQADTAAEVFEQLKSRHGSPEPYGHCKVAINDAMADWTSTVADGDTVLLFPPVAGG